MKNRCTRLVLALGWARYGLVGCVCATLWAGGVAARADEAGQAVLKSARWRVPVPAQSQGLSALAAVPGGGPIISVTSGADDGALTALDRASGKRLWTVAQNLSLLGVGEKVVVACKPGNTSAEQKLFGLSVKDGSVAYEIPLPQEYAFRLPGDVGVAGGEVMVYSNRRYTFVNSNPPPGVPPSGGGPLITTTYDLETGKQIRREIAPENAATQRAPATARGSMPVPRAVRGEDGKWYSLERPDEGDAAASGYMLVTRDGAAGKVLGQTRMEYAPGAPGAVVGQILVMREPRQSDTVRVAIDVSRTVTLTEEEKKDKLTAMDMQTGKPVWKAAVFTDSPGARIRGAGDLLVIGGVPSRRPYMPQGSWTMTVLEQASGKQLWSQRIHTDVTLYQDLMIFAQEDQWVAVKGREGKPLWSIPCDPITRVGERNPFSPNSPARAYSPCEPLMADGVLYMKIMHGGDEAGSGIFAIPLEGNAALRGKEP